MLLRRLVGSRTRSPARPHPARSSSSFRTDMSVLSSLPQYPDTPSTDCLWPRLREAVKIDPKTLVVIDDDPTGCQTVYDVNVLLDFSATAIRKELESCSRMFYILTNTRGLPESTAVEITARVVNNIYQAQLDLAASTNSPIRPVQIVSRSDSTLRGHFPAETQAIVSASPEAFDATIVCPAFFEGGRVTFGDVHYLTEGNMLVPVGESPFARDPHFGYKSSNLVDWVLEKCQGRTDGVGHLSKTMVTSISLEDIRIGGIQHVADKLESLQHGSVVVVNAVHQHDLNTFVLGLMNAESNGCSFLYRTAASFVASRGGLEPKPLVSLFLEGAARGGLTVVGSYVPKSTAQLARALSDPQVKQCVVHIEIDVAAFLGAPRDIPRNSASTSTATATASSQGPAPTPPITTSPESLAKDIDAHLAAGRHVILSTSRTFVTGAKLEHTARVSRLVTDTVAALQTPPAWLIAKGGVTSHDVAEHGLGAKCCAVVGQVEPGVPLWRMGAESKFPNMPYVVFPGNVGDDEGLLRVLRRLGVGRIEDLSPGVSEYAPKSTPPGTGSTPPRQTPKLKKDGSSSSTTPLRADSSRLLAALSQARQHSRAIAAFNVYNLEGAKAVVQAAEKMGAPIMLQVHPASLDFGGVPLLHMLSAFKATSSAPVFVHLDHASEERHVRMALEHGVDSVMVDGSALPLEENLQWTKAMAALAHSYGCLVEAELGRLVGEEDGLSVDAKEAKMTDPLVVPRFVSETLVDMLAVTIGNVHGLYQKPPQLDFARLRAIESAVSSDAVRGLRSQRRHETATKQGPVKLVLHGASGLSRELIQQAMSHGVCKFNVNTDLREAAVEVLEKAFGRGSSAKPSRRPDVLPLMKDTSAAMQAVAVDKLRLFGWGTK